MRIAECRRRIDDDLSRIRRGESSTRAQTIRHRLAAQQFHDEEDDVAASPDPIDGYDVRVLECRRGARFAQKSFDQLAIEREREGEDLDCDLALELAFTRSIHDAHATAAELLEYLVLVIQPRADEIEVGDLELPTRFALMPIRHVAIALVIAAPARLSA